MASLSLMSLRASVQNAETLPPELRVAREAGAEPFCWDCAGSALPRSSSVISSALTSPAPIRSAIARFLARVSAVAGRSPGCDQCRRPLQLVGEQLWFRSEER